MNDNIAKALDEATNELFEMDNQEFEKLMKEHEHEDIAKAFLEIGDVFLEKVQSSSDADF